MARVDYVSTRGDAPSLGFEDVMMTGLAIDGGLYVPATWPQLTAASLNGLAEGTYSEAALRVIEPFVGEDIERSALAAMTAEAYAGFNHADVAPLVQIGDGEWLLELFHGPTLAFKDFALQLLGRLFDHVLSRRGTRITIVGATSGDTGSAAIDACRGRANIEIFILHPEGRVSDVQRRQMTTVGDHNVHNIAVRGTFDDCQALVKAMFNDTRFRDEMCLSAVNSINWARVMAQIAYYCTAAAKLGGPVQFSVPTGNFGDVFAGYAAHAMGVPIARLLVATNRNDILTRALTTGDYRVSGVEPTVSPSMDIQVSSNFERLLFDLTDRNGAAVQGLMAQLATDGGFDIAPADLAKARPLFAAEMIDEEQTLATIAAVHAETGIVIDPHTAVGVAAARRFRRDPDVPMVALATAHPAKFPDAVARAIGHAPERPETLEGVMVAEEHFTILDQDLEKMQDYIRDHGSIAA
jgi:threonine synthase